MTDASRKSSILVVDDILANLRLLTDILRQHDYKVYSARSPKLGLNTAREVLPDLVLLDVNMPEMDGFEVCQKLKADEVTRDIPIIFITARDATEDIVQGLAVGGVDYIVKPFQQEEVLMRVRTHLERYHLSQALAQHAAQLQESYDELERAPRALERETLLIFLCDNGPQGRRFVGGLRGSKGNVYEGGVRSPLFVRWPGKLAAGPRSSDFGAHLDLFPTILDACGVSVPDGLELDGRSLLPVLQGEESQVPRDPLVVQWNRGNGPIHGQNTFVRHGKWKLVNHPRADVREEAAPWKPELFDLSRDRFELRDVSAEFPDQVARLTEIYSVWFKNVSIPDPYGESWTPSWPPNGPPPIRMGGQGAERVVLTRQNWRRTRGSGWGQNGSWRVRFMDGYYGDTRTPNPWSVRVIFPRGVQPTSVTLGINSMGWTYITWDSQPAEAQREITLNGVQQAWLVDKPATVSCVLTDADGKEVGPHQLIFFR